MKIPFFIVTLSTMVITRGVGFLITGGLPVAYLPDAFQAIGKGHFLGVPISVVIVIVLYGIFFIILNFTKFGRYIYAIGGNEEAVRLSGINTNVYKTFAYVLSGMMASMAGIVLASRLNSGQPTACDGWEMDAIAAVVIGGTKLSGGDGKIQMTLVGALILGVLSNGLNIMKVSSYWQFVLKGLVILIAVGFSITNWGVKNKTELNATCSVN
jgi:ribose transport system permease protein